MLFPEFYILLRIIVWPHCFRENRLPDCQTRSRVFLYFYDHSHKKYRFHPFFMKYYPYFPQLLPILFRICYNQPVFVFFP